MRIEPNDDDVVFTLFENRTPIGHPTFKASQLVKGFRTVILNSVNYDWFSQGLECQFLRVGGSGWRKGKLRLRLEFIPDEPEPSDSLALVLPPNSDQQ